MKDRNDNPKKSLADIWLNGFRQMSADQAGSTDGGQRF